MAEQRRSHQDGLREGIARAVAEARERAGLSQHELARRVGMPQTNIARIESGRHNFTVGTLARVAAALGLTVRLED